MTPTAKKVIIAIVVIVLGYFGYTTFFATTSEDVSALGDVQTGGIVGQDILVLAQKLNAISIDPSLFSSALFTNLKDFNISLNPEIQGRVNPFATIGVETSFLVPKIQNIATTSASSGL